MQNVQKGKGEYGKIIVQTGRCLGGRLNPLL